jgi:hypothetical protein
MTPLERTKLRNAYVNCIKQRDALNRKATRLLKQIYSDEPSEFWRGVHESNIEVSQWPEWKRGKL